MVSKKIPKVITQDEFEELFSHVKKLRDKAKTPKAKAKYNQRMIAMVLGFEAGLRISEIIGYKNPDKSWKIEPLQQNQIEDASVRVIGGKGGKDRIVPRPKRITEKQVKELPLSIQRRSLQKFATQIGEKVLGKHITFHTFRHGFGSHLAGMGRPLHEIQMLMGHSRLDTTGIYLHANPKQAIDGARNVF